MFHGFRPRLRPFSLVFFTDLRFLCPMFHQKTCKPHRYAIIVGKSVNYPILWAVTVVKIIKKANWR